MEEVFISKSMLNTIISQQKTIQQMREALHTIQYLADGDLENFMDFTGVIDDEDIRDDFDLVADSVKGLRRKGAR